MSNDLALTASCFTSLLGVCVWAAAVDPDGAGGRFAVASAFAAAWGVIELVHANRPSQEWTAIRTWHRRAFAWGGLLLAVRFASQSALQAGLLDSAGAGALARVQGILLGAGLAIWGNYLPKLSSPWSRADEPFDWQRVHQFVGWGALLSGLLTTLSWATLSVPIARSVTIIVVALFSALALGRKLVSLLAPPRGPSPLQTAEGGRRQ